MDKVYTVRDNDYDGQGILGVYSEKSLAVEAAARMMGEGALESERLVIDEFEVDAGMLLQAAGYNYYEVQIGVCEDCGGERVEISKSLDYSLAVGDRPGPYLGIDYNKHQFFRVNTWAENEEQAEISARASRRQEQEWEQSNG